MAELNVRTTFLWLYPYEMFYRTSSSIQPRQMGAYLRASTGGGQFNNESPVGPQAAGFRASVDEHHWSQQRMSYYASDMAFVVRQWGSRAYLLACLPGELSNLSNVLVWVVR